MKNIFKTKLWDFIVNELPFYLFFIIIFITFIVSIDYIFSGQFGKDKIPEKSKISFFDLADRIFTEKDSLSETIKSLKYSFNSIDRDTKGSLVRYGFVSVLEDYLVYLMSDSERTRTFNIDEVINIIDEELKHEPFAKLPEEQRHILENIFKAVEDTNILDVKTEVNRLNHILRLNNDKMRGLQRQTAWSIPLSIACLMLAIFFGLISIFRPLSYKKIEKIISEAKSPQVSEEDQTEID